MASAIGLFGSLPFLCSTAATFTFKDLQVERSERWATHEVIGKKPVLEHVGPQLTTVSFTIQLNSFLGIPPTAALLVLRQMIESKKPQRLLIGPDYMGKFVLESISEDRRYHNSFGIVVAGEVKLSLREVA